MSTDHDRLFHRRPDTADSCMSHSDSGKPNICCRPNSLRELGTKRRRDSLRSVTGGVTCHASRVVPSSSVLVVVQSWITIAMTGAKSLSQSLRRRFCVRKTSRRVAEKHDLFNFQHLLQCLPTRICCSARVATVLPTTHNPCLCE